MASESVNKGSPRHTNSFSYKYGTTGTTGACVGGKRGMVAWKSVNEGSPPSSASSRGVRRLKGDPVLI